ncbi:unnamed protein product [Brugia timori]|uniref:Ovule protein n=1 Tax=Brugia timori TaxID=42155 RepID=A0A0R3Q736_9BILA|nr:unnamed protein product [Brugia timori]
MIITNQWKKMLNTNFGERCLTSTTERERYLVSTCFTTTYSHIRNGKRYLLVYTSRIFSSLLLVLLPHY